MNVRKQKKWICFIMLACMLFLGMCLENIHADSFLAYESSTHSASTLLSGSRTTFITQDYPEETYIRYDSIDTLHHLMHRSMNRCRGDFSLNPAFVDVLPQIFLLIFTALAVKRIPAFSCSTVIVNYIHLTDGAKVSCL